MIVSADTAFGELLAVLVLLAHPRAGRQSGWLPMAWSPAKLSIVDEIGQRQSRLLNLYSGSVTWGGWGSNPRPTDYENYGPVHRTH